MNTQHRYAEAIAKLQDALNELNAIPPRDCPGVVYTARQQILAAQNGLELELSAQPPQEPLTVRRWHKGPIGREEAK